MEKLESRLVVAAQLIGSAGVTWTAFIKDWVGAITFVIMFLVGVFIRVQKFRQEYRHTEERHKIEMENLLKQSDEN